MKTGNIGEWSEVYALLRILADRELHAGDADLNRVESLIFPVVKILREEVGENFEFCYDGDLVVAAHGDKEVRIPVREFHRHAELLLDTLKNARERTFSVPDVQKFINGYGSHSIKAKSSDKSDVRIVVHDLRTGTTPLLGFSIKSRLGSPSTLLNAGHTTNLIYRVVGGCGATAVNAIDSKNKIRDRVAAIEHAGGRLEFAGFENSVFENNLMLIDGHLPQIVAEMVLRFYRNGGGRVASLVDLLMRENPLNYPMSENQPFYSYKVKRLLTDIALGMTPNTAWSGKLDATGGYLIVKEDGDVICYHIYNRNEFEDYLFAHTKFDTASSTRHEFGAIYTVMGDLFFKLNLQIRFI